MRWGSLRRSPVVDVADPVYASNRAIRRATFRRQRRRHGRQRRRLRDRIHHEFELHDDERRLRAYAGRFSVRVMTVMSFYGFGLAALLARLDLAKKSRFIG